MHADRRRLPSARALMVSFAFTIPVGAAVLLTPSCAAALDAQGSSDHYVLDREAVVEDDLFAAAPSIEIDGTVRGDLVAVGGTILISGWVTGSVTALARTVVVTGLIDGSVHTAAASLRVSGAIGRDVVFVGGIVRVLESGAIGRDLAVGSGDLALCGKVARDLRAMTLAVELKPGSVAGRTSGAPGASSVLTVTDCDQQSAPLSGFNVKTVLERIIEPAAPVATPLLAVHGWVLTFSLLVTWGFAFMFLAPGAVDRAACTWERRPLQAPVAGLAVLAGLAILSAIPLLSGGLSVLAAVGWEILLLVSIAGIFVPAALVVASIGGGRWLLRRPPALASGNGAALVLGAALTATAAGIAPVWGIALLLWAVSGMGAIVLAGCQKSLPDVPPT